RDVQGFAARTDRAHGRSPVEYRGAAFARRGGSGGTPAPPPGHGAAGSLHPEVLGIGIRGLDARDPFLLGLGFAGGPAVALVFGLLGHHLVDQAPRPHSAAVYVQVVELLVGVRVDTALLGREHVLVLGEDARDSLAEQRRDPLIAEAVVTREGPEVVTRLLGLGRHCVQHEARDALGPVALGSARAGRRDTHVDRDRARRLEVNDLPAVDLTRRLAAPPLELHLPERRGGDGWQPAGHGRRARAVRHLERNLGDRSPTYAGTVDERLVSEIHQIVDDQLVVALEV